MFYYVRYFAHFFLISEKCVEWRKTSQLGRVQMWTPCDRDVSAGIIDPCDSAFLNAWEWKHSYERPERGVGWKGKWMEACWYLVDACMVTAVWKTFFPPSFFWHTKAIVINCYSWIPVPPACVCVCPCKCFMTVFCSWRYCKKAFFLSGET